MYREHAIMSKSRRCCALGATMIESLLATVISGGILVGMAQYHTMATRQTLSTNTQVEQANEIMQAVEEMTEEAGMSCAVLAQYPTLGSKAWSLPSGSVVLRKPVMDADGKPVQNEFDVSVYYITPTMTADGPYKFYKRTARVVGDVEAPLGTPRLLAKNVTGLTLAYLAKQTIPVEPGRSRYLLAEIPYPALTALGNRPLVMHDGDDEEEAGNATIFGRELTCDPMLIDHGTLEVQFPVDPARLCKPRGENNANKIHLVVTGRYKVKNPDGTTSNKNIYLEEQAVLRNASIPVIQ